MSMHPSRSHRPALGGLRASSTGLLAALLLLSPLALPEALLHQHTELRCNAEAEPGASERCQDASGALALHEGNAAPHSHPDAVRIAEGLCVACAQGAGHAQLAAASAASTIAAAANRILPPAPDGPAQNALPRGASSPRAPPRA